MTLRLLATALALGALTAGCLAAAPTAPPAADPSGAPLSLSPQDAWNASLVGGALPDGAVVLTDCWQGHFYFKGRAVDFAPHVPRGFTTIEDAQGLVDLAVTPSVCAGATELWIELPVTPPLEVPDRTHVLPIVVYATDDLAASFAAWGFGERIRAASFEFTEAPAGASARLRVVAPGSTTEWVTAATTSSGPWDAYHIARWIPVDDGVAGYVDIYKTPSRSRGFGEVDMVHAGNDAPPVAGGIAHMVDGLGVAMVPKGVA